MDANITQHDASADASSGEPVQAGASPLRLVGNNIPALIATLASCVVAAAARCGATVYLGHLGGPASIAPPVPAGGEGPPPADSDVVAATVASDITGSPVTPAAATGANTDAPAAAQAAPTTPAVGQPCVFLSIGVMALVQTIVVRVPVRKLARFLNELGDATVAARLRDVQFWLQRRTSKDAIGLVEIWGHLTDIDRIAIDPQDEIEDAGIPQPTAAFRSANGFKVIEVFSRAATTEEFTVRAKQRTLAFEAGDPTSWNPSQGQRLPKCLKTLDDGSVVLVDEKAALLNPVPRDPAQEASLAPSRIRRVVGDGARAVPPGVRARILEYLDELGIPAKDQTGSHALYDSCPVCERHDTKCCYVNTGEDGSIRVVCLGGHGGEGKKSWGEHELARLAGAEMSTDGGGTFDVLGEAPVTWALVEYLRHRLRGLGREAADAALELVRVDLAAREAQPIKAPVRMVLQIHDRRLAGLPGMGPVQPRFSTLDNSLAVVDALGRSFPLRINGPSLPYKTHLHEWSESAAWDLLPIKNKEGEVVGCSVMPADSGESLFNKARAGHRGALGMLGIPLIRDYQLPIAHVEESWTYEEKTRALLAVRPFIWRSPSIKPIDPREFFLRLFHAGRLPVATENDALRYVMALLSPFLRDIAPGLLGVYWFTGPVGAGKDFFAERLSAVWESVNPGVTAKLDLNLAGEDELRKTFATAASAVYARAKEAGKTADMVELLVKLAGTDRIAARGLWRSEVYLPNAFTYIAESAEDLPDRKEISRRVVEIRVAAMGEDVSKGELATEILRNGPGLLLGAKELVETKPARWYLDQTETRSRPVIPVALAKLLDAQLDEVKGRSLDDLFEAMQTYVQAFAGPEGEAQKQKAREKDGREAAALPSYRIAHFFDTMKVRAGYSEVFRAYRNAPDVTRWLQRESAYAEVEQGRKPYLPITVGDRKLAFKLVKSRRNFILVDDAEYCAKLSCQSQHVQVPAAPTPSSPSVAVPAAPKPATAPAGPVAFSDADLLGGGAA